MLSGVKNDLKGSMLLDDKRKGKKMDILIRVARYHECGSKFGRWYNLIEMEKIIGKRTCPPKEFISFNKLRK